MSQPGTPQTAEAPRGARYGIGGALQWLGARRELVIVLALFIAASCVMTNLKTLRIDQLQGDSAMFFQVTDNIAKRGVPESGIYVNVKQFTDSKITIAPAEQLAKEPLLPPPTPEGNILRLHSYLIFYPIALIAKFIPVETTLEGMYVFGFFGLIVMAYFILRSKRVPVAAACLFGLLVMAHAAWSESLLDGQVYPDRLFVPAGFLFFYLLSKTSSRATLAAAAILCVLIHERAALTVGAVTLLYVGLYWRSVADRSFKLGIGLCALFFGLVMLKFVIYAAPYGNLVPTSLGQITAMFADPVFASEAARFVEMSLPLFLLALFEWRLALIVLVSVVPNLSGTIGGAEKIGWTTHYHSYYLPVLVWAAMEGLSNAYRWAAGRKLAPAFYAALAVIVLTANSIEPNAPSVNLTPGHIADNFPSRFYREATTFPGPTAPDFRMLAEEIRRDVPPGSAVSAPEAAMSELYHDRTVYFMPVGIDRADYAILSVTLSADKPPVYGGVITFLGPTETPKVNQVIVDRMRKDGYDMDHPKIIPSLSMAIFHRPH